MSRTRGLLAVVWLGGVLLLAARSAVSWRRASRLVRRGTAADATWARLVADAASELGLSRMPRVVRTDELHLPAVFGVRRPVLLLPAEADAWETGHRRAAVLHELAHLRRGDVLMMPVTRIATTLYWFDPIVWYAASRAAVERERACDDGVLLAGVEPTAYAERLLALAARRGRVAPASVLPLARRVPSIEERLRAILDGATPRSTVPSWRRPAAAIASGVLAALLAAIAPVAETPAQAASTARYVGRAVSVGSGSVRATSSARSTGVSSMTASVVGGRHRVTVVPVPGDSIVLTTDVSVDIALEGDAVVITAEGRDARLRVQTSRGVVSTGPALGDGRGRTGGTSALTVDRQFLLERDDVGVHMRELPAASATPPRSIRF